MSGGVTNNIVQRLWGLCNILRDDGITYQDYVTELTYLLFLKMLPEHRGERSDRRGLLRDARQGRPCAAL